MPHSGTARDGGQGECLLGRGNEDLGLVVGGDQDAYKFHLKLINLSMNTTLVSVITVHGLGRLSRTAWVVNRTVSLDTVTGPRLVSSTGMGAGKAPATPFTPYI